MGKVVSFNVKEKTTEKPLFDYTIQEEQDLSFMRNIIELSFSVEELLYFKKIIGQQFNHDEMASNLRETIFRLLYYPLKNVSSELKGTQLWTIHLVELKYINVAFEFELEYSTNPKEKVLAKRILAKIKPKFKEFKAELSELYKLRDKWQYDVMSDDWSAYVKYKND